jgi:hypothetical protein
MAKRVPKRSDRFQAPHVVAVFSVSDCNCENFTDSIPYWKHNGYWLFDSPEVIRTVARENSILLAGSSLFYYEAYEKDFAGERWTPWVAGAIIPNGRTSAFGEATGRLRRGEFHGEDVPGVLGTFVQQSSGRASHKCTLSFLTPLTRPKRTSVAGRLIRAGAISNIRSLFRRLELSHGGLLCHHPTIRSLSGRR